MKLIDFLMIRFTIFKSIQRDFFYIKKQKKIRFN